MLRPSELWPDQGRSEQPDDLTPSHVWMAPAWQEII
jgi:hypothetical protein